MLSSRLVIKGTFQIFSSFVSGRDIGSGDAVTSALGVIRQMWPSLQQEAKREGASHVAAAWSSLADGHWVADKSNRSASHFLNSLTNLTSACGSFLDASTANKAFRVAKASAFEPHVAACALAVMVAVGGDDDLMAAWQEQSGSGDALLELPLAGTFAKLPNKENQPEKTSKVIDSSQFCLEFGVELTANQAKGDGAGKASPGSDQELKDMINRAIHQARQDHQDGAVVAHLQRAFDEV